ncbi:MAG TPA: VanZ family protein [Albitalea sp.]
MAWETTSHCLFFEQTGIVGSARAEVTRGVAAQLARLASDKQETAQLQMPSFDSSHPHRVQTPSDAPWLLLRWLPFAAAAVFSLVMASQAPEGRHAFDIDWSLGRDALALSIVKAPHIGAGAALALLAVLATGRERWRVALLLTVVVGAGWEFCQSTVVGRFARASDLAPDAVGALLGCTVGLASLRIRDWAATRLGRL